MAAIFVLLAALMAFAAVPAVQQQAAERDHPLSD